MKPDVPEPGADTPPGGGLPQAGWPLAPLTAGVLGQGIPLAEPRHSTPLEDPSPTDAIPATVLWAMKFHRHLHLGRRYEEELRVCLGAGDGAIYVIDDGPNRCMIGRRVGMSSDGCTYSLVTSIDIGAYWRLARGDEPLVGAFSDTRHLSLCAVYEADLGASNVVEVQRFSRARDVPPEYLPPHPLIAFAAADD